jgi:uncharacterized protein YdeI (YjbR/CyaY-like superfamily)
MSSPSKAVDGFIRKNKVWAEPLAVLRAMLLETPLVEEIKWRTPCYTFDGNNVVMLGVMKSCCAVSFMKGALLKDKAHILEMPGENTRSARMVRFTTVDEVKKQLPTLKNYVLEAIELEKAGVKFDFAATRAMDLPEELEAIFAEMPDFKKAFEALTPGRQRGWLIHFSGAKQSQTRTSRIEKAMPTIFEGKGMLDDAPKRCRPARDSERTGPAARSSHPTEHLSTSTFRAVPSGLRAGTLAGYARDQDRTDWRNRVG